MSKYSKYVQVVRDEKVESYLATHPNKPMAEALASAVKRYQAIMACYTPHFSDEDFNSIREALSTMKIDEDPIRVARYLPNMIIDNNLAAELENLSLIELLACIEKVA